MPQAKVLVIVVNWNNADDTSDCIDSVMEQSHTHFDLIVVDNASESADYDALKNHCTQYPEIQLFQNSENIGFTQAVNQCLESHIVNKQDYEFVALLNNDAVAKNDWLENLIKTAHQHPNVLIASQMIQSKNPEKIDSAGLYLLDTGEVLPRGYGDKTKHYQKAQKVIGPCGGAALYPVQVFKNMGIFDHCFPMGYEDVEFALRSFTRGVETWYEPTAKVHHKGSVSIAKIKSTEFLIQTQYQLWRAFLQYAPWFVLTIGIIFITIRLMLVFLWWLISFQWRTIGIWIRAIGRTLKNCSEIMSARKIAQKNRTISTFKFLQSQHSFLVSDITRAWRRLRAKQKSYFNS